MKLNSITTFFALILALNNGLINSLPLPQTDVIGTSSTTDDDSIAAKSDFQDIENGFLAGPNPDALSADLQFDAPVDVAIASDDGSNLDQGTRSDPSLGK